MRARRAPARVIVMTRVAAPTALVLVEDSAGGESAVAVPGQLASATPTSVAVGCAGTDIRLGDLIEVTVPTTATQVRIRANAPSSRPSSRSPSPEPRPAWRDSRLVRPP